MTYSTIDYQIDNAVLTITLNRPDHMNAFTVTMANELEEAFKRASEDDAVRAIVVTGAGKAFCAGMDLKAEGNVFGLDESTNPGLDDIERLDDPEIINGLRDTGGRVTLAIYDCKKPVIAAINGAAVGIGITMTLAMDIRLASDKARMGFVFNRIGIVPEACSSWFLPRVVGLSQALEWTYAADVFDADEAKRGGLVKDVYSPEQLLDEAYAIARRLAKKSPMAIALTRQMLYRNSAAPHPEEAHKIDSLGVFYAAKEDGKEGIAAFLEKREAQFTSKASEMPAFYDEWIKRR
ncbi:crotonase/enoyl-CoA hydratase family protein [Spongiibacter nanhainus]|uniref:Crotonase/enoyl-CoA hydratase family protein n=1 Tax=Spongiibacter nanhainus TaxID=2794344 RepID=A0A7T4QZH2_9GAMM|nr:crotonase/enoyl-CoA hydratase family protein [Spongiibacter nanhainus]QQD17668.1 crotonase/enoyl-CoA hydratase family protein [Spongiibacter nanhainus]